VRISTPGIACAWPAAKDHHSASAGAGAPRPQTDTLTAEIARLKAAERALRSRHAAEREELRNTIGTHAQHFHALTLRLAELEATNTTLRGHLGPNITAFPGA
jgi:hypothetical protein